MTGGASIDVGAVLAGVVVDVGGLALALGADDPDRAEAVASLFRHAVPVAPGTRPDAVVRFTSERTSGADPAPVGPPTTETPHADLWHRGGGLLVVRTRAGLTLTATTDALVVGGDAAALSREFRFVAIIGLTHLLARHDRHLLHGAAIEIDDALLLVLGASGTGKSTLAFAAHRLGWSVLSDDTVLARRADGGVRVGGVPRPIAVAADVTDAIAGGRPVPDDYRARTELPAGTLTIGEHPVTHLAVTVGADPRGAGIDPLGGVEALRAVLQASISLVDAEVRPELFALGGALARLPRWSVRHGSDPARALGDATTVLESLRSRVEAGS